jgi:hypothetical protein
MWRDKEETDTSFRTLCQNSPGGIEDECGALCGLLYNVANMCHLYVEWWMNGE